MIEQDPLSKSPSPAAVAASMIVLAGPGRLFTATLTNTSNGDRYFQYFDSLTVPADTAVPIQSLKVPAGTTGQFDFSFWGRKFTTGIVLVVSTTQATKTIEGAASGLIDCTYGVRP